MSRTRQTASLLLAAVLLVLGAALLPAGASAKVTERTVTMRYGPVPMGSFSTERPKAIVPAPDVDGHITRMHAKLVDRRGRRLTIQQTMLHHVVFINQGRFPGDRKPKCGARFGEPFYGTGEENQSLDLPDGYGYRVRRGDRWKMQTMLMSHQAKRQEVFVEYKMRVVTGRRLMDVTPYWVRVTPCRNEPSYSVAGGGAAGSVDRRTAAWKVPADGRIVAAGAHLHGGAHDIELTQRRCGGRRLINSDPTYGGPDHISYSVKPLLHEPGPVNTGWFESHIGIPVRKGETLDVTALYDGQWQHPGVMGVYHVYVAHGHRPGVTPCPELPKDRVTRTLDGGDLRDDPPHVVVPLTELDANGRPVTLDRPRGESVVFPDGTREVVTDVLDRFSRPRISITPGTTLTWAFRDTTAHKVSIANGPRAMGSPSLARGGRWSWGTRAPGRYQLFCYLHPTTMHQEVEVRAPDGSVPLIAPTAPGGDPGVPPQPGAAGGGSGAPGSAGVESGGGEYY
jgi:hypothetical protein